MDCGIRWKTGGRKSHPFFLVRHSFWDILVFFGEPTTDKFSYCFVYCVNPFAKPLQSFDVPDCFAAMRKPFHILGRCSKTKSINLLKKFLSFSQFVGVLLRICLSTSFNLSSSKSLLVLYIALSFMDSDFPQWLISSSIFSTNAEIVLYSFDSNNSCWLYLCALKIHHPFNSSFFIKQCVYFTIDFFKSSFEIGCVFFWHHSSMINVSCTSIKVFKLILKYSNWVCQG